MLAVPDQRAAPATPRGEAPVAYGHAAWSDLPAVYRLHRASFPSAYSIWRFFSYHLSTAADILIACAGGPVVGYLVLNRATHYGPPRRVGEIISVAVAQAHRRHGVGRALLGEAHRLLERDGISECLLQVAVDNHGARRLYEQMGYTNIERLPRYYGNGDDAYLMCRRA